MHLRKILSVLLLLAVVPVQSVFAAAGAEVQDDAVVFDFPNTATFSATLKSAAAITAVTLEYGNEQQTCGEVIAKAFPQFDPSTTVQAGSTSS